MDPRERRRVSVSTLLLCLLLVHEVQRVHSLIRQIAQQGAYATLEITPDSAPTGDPSIPMVQTGIAKDNKGVKHVVTIHAQIPFARYGVGVGGIAPTTITQHIAASVVYDDFNLTVLQDSQSAVFQQMKLVGTSSTNSIPTPDPTLSALFPKPSVVNSPTGRRLLFYTHRDADDDNQAVADQLEEVDLQGRPVPRASLFNRARGNKQDNNNQGASRLKPALSISAIPRTPERQQQVRERGQTIFQNLKTVKNMLDTHIKAGGPGPLPKINITYNYTEPIASGNFSSVNPTLPPILMASCGGLDTFILLCPDLIKLVNGITSIGGSTDQGLALVDPNINPALYAAALEVFNAQKATNFKTFLQGLLNSCQNDVSQPQFSFCFKAESTAQYWANAVAKLTQAQTSLLSQENIISQQTQLDALLKQKDQNMQQLYSNLVAQGQLQQQQLDALNKTLQKDAQLTFQLNATLAAAAGAFDQVQQTFLTDITVLAGEISGAAQQLAATQSFTALEVFLLNSSINALQEHNAFVKSEILFALIQAENAVSTIAALANTVARLGTSRDDLAALVQVCATAIIGMYNANQIPFTTSVGGTPPALTPAQKYPELKRLTYYFVQQNVVRRVNWAFYCDETYFAVSSTDVLQFTVVDRWFANRGTPLGSNQPPINVSNICYSTYIEEISTSPTAFNAALHGIYDPATEINSPPPIGTGPAFGANYNPFTSALNTSVGAPPSTINNGVLNMAAYSSPAQQKRLNSSYIIVTRQYLYSPDAMLAFRLGLCYRNINNTADIIAFRAGTANATGYIHGESAQHRASRRANGWFMNTIERPRPSTRAVNQTILLSEFNTAAARPYCTGSAADILSMVALTGGMTIPFLFYSSMVDAVASNAPLYAQLGNSLRGTLPSHTHVESRKQMYQPGNLVGLSNGALARGEAQIAATRQGTKPSISYHTNYAYLASVSPDAVPVWKAFNKRVIPNVWTSTSLNPGEVIDPTLQFNSNITTVEMFGTPFDKLRSSFAFMGYPQCWFTKCPVRVTRLNRTTGHIDAIESFGPGGSRSQIQHALDVDASSVQLGNNIIQSKFLPTAIRLLMEASSFTTPYNNASRSFNSAIQSSSFRSGYNGYEYRAPAPTPSQMELQTGQAFNPYYATVGASAYITEVAISPDNPFDIRCVGRHASYTGLCSLFDSFLTVFNFATGTWDFYPRGTDWSYQVTVKLLPNDGAIVHDDVPAGCPSVPLQYQPRDLDYATLLITDTTANAPNLNLTLFMTPCNITKSAKGEIVATSASSTQFTRTIRVNKLTPFTTRTIVVQSCANMQVKLVSQTTGATCYAPLLLPSLNPEVVGSIPQRANVTMQVSIDQLGRSIQSIGVAISQQQYGTYNSLSASIAKIFSARSAAELEIVQQDLAQIAANLRAELTAIQFILANTTFYTNVLSDAEHSILRVVNALVNLGVDKLRQLTSILQTALLQSQDILNQMQSVLGHLAQLLLIESADLTGLQNANHMMVTAGPDYSWDNLALFWRLLNGTCPSQWADNQSSLACNLNFNPNSWLQCIQGQWIGARDLVYAFLLLLAFVPFCWFIIIAVATFSTPTNPVAAYYNFAMYGIIPPLASTLASATTPPAATKQ